MIKVEQTNLSWRSPENGVVHFVYVEEGDDHVHGQHLIHDRCGAKLWYYHVCDDNGKVVDLKLINETVNVVSGIDEV